MTTQREPGSLIKDRWDPDKDGKVGVVVISLLGFVAASTLVIVIPGPDTLFVLRSVLKNGRRRARRSALGTISGLTIWAFSAVLGLSALLRASHAGYDALRLVGAVYLCAIGTLTLLSHGATAELDVHHERHRLNLLGTGYIGGLTTNLLNPKVGVFFVTFLPAFVPRGASVEPTTLLLGVMFVAETSLYFVLFLTFVDRIVEDLRRPRLRRALDYACGVVLIGFGVRLAVES